MAFSLRGRVATLVIVGLVSTILGVALFLFFPPFLKTKIQQALILSEDSMIYETWRKPNVPIYSSFFLFNILNPGDISANKSKPLIEEVGPFTFRETKEKVNITWHDNGTVSYIEIRRFFYRPDLSNGSLDDIITTLNGPMLGAYHKAKLKNSMMLNFALNAFIHSMDIKCFVNKTIRELLFEGYEDVIINTVRNFMTVPHDRFGWTYKKNGSSDGLITMFTGKEDITKKGIIDQFKGSPVIGSLDSPCNNVNGSTGQVFPPLYNVHKITLLIPGICRVLPLNFLGKTEVNGIMTYRYYGDHTGFDNGQHVPENKCFCASETCLPSGAHDMSNCPPNAPTAASYPHFLYADSSYHQSVTGLRPDPKKHSIILDINPDTGIVLKGSLKLQINMAFSGNDGISYYAPKIYIPVFWGRTSFTMTEDLTTRLKFVLYTVPLITYAIAFFFIGFGTALVVAAFALAIVYKFQNVKPKYAQVNRKVVNLNEINGSEFAMEKMLNGRHDR